MADYLTELPAPTSRIVVPVTFRKQTIAGNDLWRISAGWLLEVPNVWTLNSALVQIVCDATVANRQVNIVSYKGSNATQQLERVQSAAVTASQTKTIALGNVIYFSTLTAKSDQYGGLSGGNLPFVISGDDQLIINCTNGVAGDTLNCWVNLEYQNWKLGMDLPPALRGWFNPSRW